MPTSSGPVFCGQFSAGALLRRADRNNRQNELDADRFSPVASHWKTPAHFRADHPGKRHVGMHAEIMEDLSGAGITAMVVGQVQHVWIDADQSPERRCGKDGYMMLMPGAQNLKTGAPNPSVIASLTIEKRDSRTNLIFTTKETGCPKLQDPLRTTSFF
ncbi:MAG: hypothetical protein ACLVJ6_09120 [Merdibacter sp.]